MDIQEVISMLTEGLDAEQAKVVRAAIERDAVKAKVGGLKQAKEFEELAAREAELRSALEGTPEKPGAKAYREWYDKNYAAVQKLQADQAKYVEKYGTLDAPKPEAGAAGTPPPGLSKDDIARMVDERIQGGYAPRWSDLLTGMGSIVQKHMFAGRKTPIDMKALSTLAEKFGGDLDRAYDEYDRPEREKATAAETEATIKRRVDEELQKRGATTFFPSAADATPGTLSRDRSSDKFDKGAMEKDLVSTFLTGKDPGELTGFGVN